MGVIGRGERVCVGRMARGELGGWGRSQWVEEEEDEHTEMEGFELNMYVLSALLYHSGGTLAFCGVCIFACVCMWECACTSQSGLSHISRGHLPRFSAE